MFFYGVRENQRWQTGNINLLFKRPFATSPPRASSNSTLSLLQFLAFRLSTISAFYYLWHFRVLQFLTCICAIPGISAPSAISGISTTSPLSMAMEILIGRFFIAFTLMFRFLFRFVLSTWIGSRCM